MVVWDPKDEEQQQQKKKKKRDSYLPEEEKPVTMIEQISLKKLVIFTLFLIGCCVLMLTLEGYLVETNVNSTALSRSRQPHEEERGCWNTEEFLISEPCTPCSEFDRKSQHIEVCTWSRNREVVSCAKSGEVYRSCRSDSTLLLIKFELITWIVGAISAAFVIVRKRTLDKRMYQRIQAQVAAGV